MPQHSKIAVTNYGRGHCPQRLASVVLVQGVFVLVKGVLVLVHAVFVLVKGVFVLVTRGFLFGPRGLRFSPWGLRSSFLEAPTAAWQNIPGNHRIHGQTKIFELFRSRGHFGVNYGTVNPSLAATKSFTLIIIIIIIIMMMIMITITITITIMIMIMIMIMIIIIITKSGKESYSISDGKMRA